MKVRRTRTVERGLGGMQVTEATVYELPKGMEPLPDETPVDEKTPVSDWTEV